MRERYHLEYLVLDGRIILKCKEYLVSDGRIILKCIFKKWDGACTVLIWLRIGTVCEVS